MMVTAVAPVLLHGWARLAHWRQGADRGRVGERFGRASVARPDGSLVWIHAASVGEVASVARLGREILVAEPGRTLLLTTTTTTGATTAARLVPGAIHQFLPVDSPAAVAGFLEHWRPDAALFVEADLWPRLIFSLERRTCPMALLNARHSRSRQRFPTVYAALLSRMDLITVQDRSLLDGLVALGLDPARLHAPGNLKADVVAPAVDQDLSRALTGAAEGRGIWAAVSTHAGEEDVVVAAHLALPGRPLLVLVPRHPERSDTIAEALRKRGIAFTRQSKGELPETGTRVHLVDVLGVTGTVYAAAGLAFIGGSLIPGIGGHTPYEPAALGCAVLSGEHVANFSRAYRALAGAGAAQLLSDPAALQPEVARLLENHRDRSAMQAAAKAFHAVQAGAVDATLALLARVLPPEGSRNGRLPRS